MIVDNDTTKVWLIVGSSSGFGRTIADAALARGDRVAAAARRTIALERLVASAPDRAMACELDVTDASQVDAAVSATLERFGRIDVLVNCAGYGSVGAVEELVAEDLRALMDTMFFGAVATTKAVLPHMRRQGSGAVVQLSSMGGQLSPPGFGAYCSAKFALEAMSESLAAEVAPLGIRVLIVEPGAFRTEFGGAAMHRSRSLDAYTATVGPTRDAVDAMDGNQPGDPQKAATAILDLLDTDDPPLRIALGDDAVDAIRAKHDQLRSELDAWEHLSRATGFAAA